jgi:hypothetical protein
MGVVRYRCPACGFQIFNRRLAKCESCGAALPSDLLLNDDQKATLDANHEKGRKARAGRKRADRSGDTGGGGSGTWWDVGGDGGGDGGGGD